MVVEEKKRENIRFIIEPITEKKEKEKVNFILPKEPYINEEIEIKIKTEKE